MVPPPHYKQLYSNVPPQPRTYDDDQPTTATTDGTGRGRRRARQMADVNGWCMQMALLIDTGRLHCLDKVAAVIAHLEPRTAPLYKPSALADLLLLPAAPAQPQPTTRTTGATAPEVAFAKAARLDLGAYDLTTPSEKAGGFGPLSVQLVKTARAGGGPPSSAKAKVMVENLFHWRCVSEVFQVVDAQRLSYANLYDALDLGDMSLVLRSEWRKKLTPRAEAIVVCFLLLLLYVKLCIGSRGSDDVGLLFSKLKHEVNHSRRSY